MTNEEILDNLNLCPAGGGNNVVIKAMDAAREDEAKAFGQWLREWGKSELSIAVLYELFTGKREIEPINIDII